MEPSADHVSLAAGLDGPGSVALGVDVDAPLDVHESHDLVLYHRWSECARCGARDHWPAIGEPCPGLVKVGTRKGKAGAPVSLAEALRILRADLEAFGVWAEQEGHAQDRPDLPEWCAEFLAWTHGPGGRR